MTTSSEETGLAAKLAAPAAKVVEQHRDVILKLLGGESAGAVQAAIRNDESVRKVAMFCYPLLPGLVRLAVKEPTFIDFVLRHRETVLDRIVRPQPA
jgi:hypothetical protein